jgi:hypothetical protein
MYILVHSNLFFGGKNSLKNEIKNKKIFEILKSQHIQEKFGKVSSDFYTRFQTSSPSSLVIWLNIPKDDCHISYIKKMQETTPIHLDQKLGFTRMLVQMQLQHKSIYIFESNLIN